MDNQQLQNKITALEKQVQKLKNELKYEEIAHNTLLEEKRKELAQKQTEIANYENQLRAERNQNANLNLELQAKDIRIQELIGQLEVMTNLLQQDLTRQTEFPPKGQF